MLSRSVLPPPIFLSITTLNPLKRPPSSSTPASRPPPKPAPVQASNPANQGPPTASHSRAHSLRKPKGAERLIRYAETPPDSPWPPSPPENSSSPTQSLSPITPPAQTSPTRY